MNLINKKRVFNIIIDIFLIIICSINIFFNLDTYINVLTNDYLILNDISKLDNNKFVYVDLKKAKQEIYSLKSENLKIDLYTINLNNKDILILLKENTITTDKVALEVIKDESITNDLKDKLKDNYYEKVLSNMDFNNDYKIELFKVYILFGIISFSIISIIINIILIKK